MSDADELVTVAVVPGYLVCVDGEQQTGGTVQVPAGHARLWLAAGFVISPESVKPARARRSR